MNLSLVRASQRDCDELMQRGLDFNSLIWI